MKHLNQQTKFLPVLQLIQSMVRKPPEVKKMIDALDKFFAALMSDLLGFDMNSVNVDQNDLSTILENDGVEVLNSNSAYLANSSKGNSSCWSINSSPLKKIFVKKRRGSAENSSPTKNRNHIIKSAQDDHLFCDEVTNESVNIILRRRSDSCYVLNSSQRQSLLPVESSSSTQNFIIPAQLDSEEKIQIPSEELQVKNEPPPVQLLSSVYFNSNECEFPAQRFHIQAQGTSLVKRSSSEYSKISAASKTKSGALVLSGSYLCVDSHAKDDIDGSVKVMGNRHPLQFALLSISQLATGGSGIEPLDAGPFDCKNEESPSDAGHSVLPAFINGTNTGLILSRISTDPDYNEPSNATVLNSSIGSDPLVMNSFKSRKSSKIISSDERRKLFSKALLINDHGDYEYQPSLTGEQCYYKSIEEMKHVMKLLHKALKEDKNNCFYTKQESERFSYDLIDLKERVKILTRSSASKQDENNSIKLFKPLASERNGSLNKKSKPKRETAAVTLENSLSSCIRPLDAQILNGEGLSYEEGTSDTCDSDLSFTFDSDISDKHACPSIDPNSPRWAKILHESNVIILSNGSDTCNYTFLIKGDSSEEDQSFEEFISEFPETLLDDEDNVDKDFQISEEYKTFNNPLTITSDDNSFKEKVKHGNMLLHLTMEERQHYNMDCLRKAVEEYEKAHGPI